jgi:hypothetical protein
MGKISTNVSAAAFVQAAFEVHVYAIATFTGHPLPDELRAPLNVMVLTMILYLLPEHFPNKTP